VKNIKTEEYKGEDRRVDVTKLEFGISTVIRIIIVVAVIVSTGVIYQLQIQNNTKELESINEALEEQSLLHIREIDMLHKKLNNLDKSKVDIKEYRNFKKWVEDEI